MDTRTLRYIATIIAILIGIVVVGRIAASRLANAKQQAAAYALACEGPPLRSVEQREKAQEAGYVINQVYDCIDKKSFIAAAEEKARWQAANTPEAKAREAAIRAAHEAENASIRALAAAIHPQAAAEPAPEADPEIPYRALDANTAPETELATAFGLSPETAKQMIEERGKRPFKDWPDMVNRVTGLSSARNSMFANIGGLNVNGEPLPGGPPDATMIRFARDSLRKGNATGLKVIAQ